MCTETLKETKERTVCASVSSADVYRTVRNGNVVTPAIGERSLYINADEVQKITTSLPGVVM